MKLINSHVFLLFLLFAFLVFHLSDARLLAAKQGQLTAELKVNHDDNRHEDPYIGIRDDLFDLMGSESEGCDVEDEECSQRRMTKEAHLDYIYTQHHKP